MMSLGRNGTDVLNFVVRHCKSSNQNDISIWQMFVIAKKRLMNLWISTLNEQGGLE